MITIPFFDLANRSALKAARFFDVNIIASKDKLKDKSR